MRFVTSIARSLGMVSVAEGVETPEQIAFLRQCQCDHFQGCYFGRPLASLQFTTDNLS
ncbi:EAL domain-containing protein [Geoalkalibacter subterraneus]|uniref:EAL domain-containing protein n=1 Tax=Geoalkalibacter subterraneus TaxID=483547 RepID=UPI00339046EF